MSGKTKYSPDFVDEFEFMDLFLKHIIIAYGMSVKNKK